MGKIMRKYIILGLILWIGGCEYYGVSDADIEQIIQDATENLEDPEAYAYAGEAITENFIVKLSGNHDGSCEYQRYTTFNGIDRTQSKTTYIDYKIRNGETFESTTRSKWGTAYLTGKISSRGHLKITNAKIPPKFSTPKDLNDLQSLTDGRLVFEGDLTVLKYSGVKFDNDHKFNFKKYMLDFTRFIADPYFTNANFHFANNTFRARAFRMINDRKSVVISGKMNLSARRVLWDGVNTKTTITGAIILDYESGLPRYSLMKIETYADNRHYQTTYSKEKCRIEAVD